MNDSTDSINAEQQNHNVTWPIVGIGSSAGGIEALTSLVKGLHVGTDCSFVVIQHLSPHYRSMLVQLLGRDTNITVKEVHDGELVQRDVLYVAPAAYNVIIKNGAFELLEPPQTVSPKPSVDVFLRSLAVELGEASVAVILSGTGKDGAIGVKAVKSAGGSVIVQEPEDAKYDGMPLSAIETGLADLIIPAEAIASHIQTLASIAGLTGKVSSDIEFDTRKTFELLSYVKSEVGIDFRGYKETSLSRRVSRRLAVTKTKTIEEYLEYLKKEPSELNKLVREILISVTSFFRDREAFDALAKTIDSIIESKNSDDNEFRAWIAGCATGEEAYSIAILALESIRRAGKNIAVKVYATDIDENAIGIARRGVYPMSAIAEMPKGISSQYMLENTETFEVSKALRETVVFARQDLVSDPPFMHMDLISCRNVLIYFKSELQSKILSMAYNSLRPDGYLFLGRSESVNQQQDLFVPVSNRWRLFKPTGGRHSSSESVKSQSVKAPMRSNVERKRKNHIEELFINSILSQYAPAAVLVNAGLEVLHSWGDLEGFLRFPSGQPRLSLTNLIRDEFRTDIQVLVHQALKEQKGIKGRAKKLKGQKNRKSVRIAVYPILDSHIDELFLISFERVSRGTAEKAETSSGVIKVETELSATREHLQTLNEELETSNEEMQALTEELQASNEELQATNEELEASNEELQATNEELVTLNQEMLQKSRELSILNAEFENVNNSIAFPIIVLDGQLSIRRLNQSASHVLNLPFAVRGQQLSGLGLPAPFDQITSIAADVLKNSRYRSSSIQTDGKYYDVEVSPCVEADGSTTGVIVALIDNTDLHAAEREAQEVRQRMTDVMNHSNFIFSVKDLRGRYLFINKKFEQVYGVCSNQVVGKSDHDILPKEIANRFKSGDLEVLRMGELMEAEECYQVHDAEKCFRTLRFPLGDNEDGIHSICMQAEEVTEKKHAEEQLRLAAKVFHRAGEGISVTDDRGRIITVNEAFTDVTGYSAEEVIGKTPAILQSGKHTKEFYIDMWNTIDREGSWQGEIWNKRKNGELYPEWLTVNSVVDNDGKVTNYVGIFSDISVIKKSQRRIEYLATYDELTDLPNRNLFMDRLKHALSRMKRDNDKLIVMFIDLDNFKQINDTMGHDCGDLLLKEAACRLKECVREQDTLARLGGDEFTVLLEKTDYEGASVIAERILDYLSASFNIQGKQMYVSASVGMSGYPLDGRDSQTLLKHADTAMYRAKELGKNQYCTFTSDMRVIAQQRLAMETGLRQSIHEGSFDLVFQPIVDVKTSRIISAEALLRWNMPGVGPISPAQFIPVAEQAGLISGITSWVAKEVISKAGELRKNFEDAPTISINLSGHDFRLDGITSQLERLVEEQNLEAKHISLEMTETTLMEHSEQIIDNLFKFKEQGFGISIDDFGTGYSSLSYLKKYPISTLKVDRSFVDGLGSEADDSAISKAIIEMAHALGMTVIAEGVETEKQLGELAKLGCNQAQGYFFYKPMPFDDFVELLNQRNDEGVSK